MERAYLQILLLVLVSSASCSQSSFKLPPLNFGRYKENECKENFWKCPGENKCIKLSELCDGKNDKKYFDVICFELRTEENGLNRT